MTETKKCKCSNLQHGDIIYVDKKGACIVCGTLKPSILGTETKRSTAQNKSLHKLFGDISRYCIEHNIDMQTVMEHMKRYRCEASTTAVKSTWHDIQKTLLNKSSTTELTTQELNEVYEEFSKMWSEITKQHFPFPSYDSLAMQHLIDSQV
jgi:deoxyribodipyrimidine photolyase